MLFPHGDEAVEQMRILPQTMMAIVGIYSTYLLISNYNKIRRGILFKPFLSLLIMAGIYIIYPCDSFEGLYENTLFVLKSYMAILFMFAVYINLKKGGENNFKYIYYLYFIQIVYAFYKLYTDRMMFISGEHELFDSNAGFMLICLLPAALILPNNQRLKLYLSALIILGCVYSGQRSAALASVVCIPFFINYIKKGIKHTDVFLFLIAFIFVAWPILTEAIDNINMRNELDASKDSFGSGRSIFWLHVWEGFRSGDIVQHLFGFGTNTVPILLKETYGMAIGAHNGWLDALYSYGLIGLYIYSTTIFVLLIKNKYVNRNLKEYKNILLILFILFFVKSITSHGYWDIAVMPYSLVIAVIAYKLDKKRNNNVQQNL